MRPLLEPALAKLGNIPYTDVAPLGMHSIKYLHKLVKILGGDSEQRKRDLAELVGTLGSEQGTGKALKALKRIVIATMLEEQRAPFERSLETLNVAWGDLLPALEPLEDRVETVDDIQTIVRCITGAVAEAGNKNSEEKRWESFFSAMHAINDRGALAVVAQTASMKLAAASMKTALGIYLATAKLGLDIEDVAPALALFHTRDDMKEFVAKLASGDCDEYVKGLLHTLATAEDERGVTTALSALRRLFVFSTIQPLLARAAQAWQLKWEALKPALEPLESLERLEDLEAVVRLIGRSVTSALDATPSSLAPQPPLQIFIDLHAGLSNGTTASCCGVATLLMIQTRAKVLYEACEKHRLAYADMEAALKLLAPSQAAALIDQAQKGPKELLVHLKELLGAAHSSPEPMWRVYTAATAATALATGKSFGKKLRELQIAWEDILWSLEPLAECANVDRILGVWRAIQECFKVLVPTESNHFVEKLPHFEEKLLAELTGLHWLAADEVGKRLVIAAFRARLKMPLDAKGLTWGEARAALLEFNSVTDLRTALTKRRPTDTDVFDGLLPDSSVPPSHVSSSSPSSGLLVGNSVRPSPSSLLPSQPPSSLQSRPPSPPPSAPESSPPSTPPKGPPPTAPLPHQESPAVPKSVALAQNPLLASYNPADSAAPEVEASSSTRLANGHEDTNIHNDATDDLRGTTIFGRVQPVSEAAIVQDMETFNKEKDVKVEELVQTLSSVQKRPYMQTLYAYHQEAVDRATEMLKHQAGAGSLKKKMKEERLKAAKVFPPWMNTMPQRGVRFWAEQLIPAGLMLIAIQVVFAHMLSQTFPAHLEIDFVGALYHCALTSMLQGSTQKWLANPESRLLGSFHMLLTVWHTACPRFVLPQVAVSPLLAPLVAELMACVCTRACRSFRHSSPPCTTSITRSHGGLVRGYAG